MALTKILDKLVQIGPGYLDQTLRTYVASNRDLKLYTRNDKSYAVIAYYTSGKFVLNETKNVDILLVGGGGGSSIGNLTGGSGAGEVVVVENALLPNGEYTIEVGAGGAGGTHASGGTVGLPVDATAVGSVGQDTKFYRHGAPAGPEALTAQGGGVGGYRNPGGDILSLTGGSGGGAGGADYDPGTTSFKGYAGANAPTAYELGAGATLSTNSLGINVYFTGNVYSYGNAGGNSHPWSNNPITATSIESYHAGGGGGAGTKGGDSNIHEAGSGGDGVTVDWVNEVYKEAYHFNGGMTEGYDLGKVYWGGGGGGAASRDEEPGDGGMGGGGGGAGWRSIYWNTETSETDYQLFWDGNGGKYGINDGHDAKELLGGHGGKNTGGGAGGTMYLDNSVKAEAQRDITLGNNGGSGVVLIRIHLDSPFSPYSQSLTGPYNVQP